MAGESPVLLRQGVTHPAICRKMPAERFRLVCRGGHELQICVILMVTIVLLLLQLFLLRVHQFIPFFTSS